MLLTMTSANPENIAYNIIGYPRRANRVEISEPVNLIYSEMTSVAKKKPLGPTVVEGLSWDDQFKKAKGKNSAGPNSSKKKPKQKVLLHNPILIMFTRHISKAICNVLV